MAAALSGLDQSASAYRAARPRALKMADLAASNPRSFRQKIGNFLLRRGFGYEVTREVVARLEAELTNEPRMTEED